MLPVAEKRPCCQLLRQLTSQVDACKDPAAVAQALEILSRECVLLKTLGQGRISVDAVKLNCFLHVSPDSGTLASEIGKTVMSNLGLQQKYALLLAAMNEVLAKNAQAQQIGAYLIPLLAEIRAGESKFGAVLADTQTLLDHTGLEQGHGLQGHPLLLKTQMLDGISDKTATPNPQDNPKAEAQLEHQLKMQLNKQLDLANAPKAPPPRFTRT